MPDDHTYRYKDEKMRRPFQVEDDNGNVLATGIQYEQGNVQVLWRKDIGDTGEQHCNIAQCFGIVPGANVIRVNLGGEK